MAAAKGNNYNPNGRPVGAKSAKTRQWEEFAEYCLNEGLEKFFVELNKQNGKDYVAAFLHLLEYFKPKLSRIEGKREEQTVISISDLFTEAQKTIREKVSTD